MDTTVRPEYTMISCRFNWRTRERPRTRFHSRRSLLKTQRNPTHHDLRHVCMARHCWHPVAPRRELSSSSRRLHDGHLCVWMVRHVVPLARHHGPQRTTRDGSTSVKAIWRSQFTTCTFFSYISSIIVGFRRTWSSFSPFCAALSCGAAKIPWKKLKMTWDKTRKCQAFNSVLELQEFGVYWFSGLGLFTQVSLCTNLGVGNMYVTAHKQYLKIIQQNSNTFCVCR